MNMFDKKNKQTSKKTPGNQEFNYEPVKFEMPIIVTEIYEE